MEQAIAEAADDSSRTVSFVVWRTGQILAERGQAGLEPSRATMFRLFSRLSAGKHTTVPAATRRSLAGRPQRKFPQAQPTAPGKLMEIDSTPLDALVLLDDGVPGRVDLTAVIDVATRMVPAAVIGRRRSPPTPACCWPEPCRPSRCGRAGRPAWRWRTRPCLMTGCWASTRGRRSRTGRRSIAADVPVRQFARARHQVPRSQPALRVQPCKAPFRSVFPHILRGRVHRRTSARRAGSCPSGPTVPCRLPKTRDF